MLHYLQRLLMYPTDRRFHSCLPQLDLRTYIGTIEYTETEEEEKNVKVLDLVKAGEIAFSTSSSDRPWLFNVPCMPTLPPVQSPATVP